MRFFQVLWKRQKNIAWKKNPFWNALAQNLSHVNSTRSLCRHPRAAGIHVFVVRKGKIPWIPAREDDGRRVTQLERSYS